MRLLALFFLLSAQQAFPQIVVFPFLQVDALKGTKIEFERRKAPEKESAFDRISIIDLRQDTVTTGYVKFRNDFSKYFRLEMKHGVQAAAAFLNSYYAPGMVKKEQELVILLKNIFLTQDYKMPSTGVDLIGDVYTSKAFVSAHLLLHKDDRYFLLGNADTVLLLNKWLGKSYNKIAAAAFTSLVEKAEQLLADSPSEAVDYTAFRAQVAVRPLAVAGAPEGFYTSYADFRNRKSKRIAIRYEQRKRGKVLRPLTSADTTLTRHAWGFVENGELYVRNNYMYIHMQPHAGSLSGLGIDTYEVVKLPIPIDPLNFAIEMVDIVASGPVAVKQPYKLFRLNMETGRLE